MFPILFRTNQGLERKIVSQETVENIIVTAIEGGSNYWYLIEGKAQLAIEQYPKHKEEPFSIRFARFIFDGGQLEIHDCSSVWDLNEQADLLGTISNDSIAKGLKLAFEMQAGIIEAELEGSGDAETSDQLFQLFVMGEIVYG